MSRFSLRGSTALIALSLSLTLALPLASGAQEPPAAALEAADWQPVTRFGFTFSVPPGLAVTEDSPHFYAVSSLDDAHTQGAYFGAQILNAASFAQVPAPDAPGFTAFLSQIGRVPVEPTGVQVQMGRFTLQGYRGSEVGEDGVERHALFLVSQSLDENGEAMVIAVLSAGIGGAAAGALEARFLTSFGVVEEPVETPEMPVEEDGALEPELAETPMAAMAPEVGDAEAGEAEATELAAAEPAETDSAETDSAAMAEAGTEAPAADAPAALAEAPVATEPDTATTGAQTEPAGEAVVEGEPQSVELIPGLARLALPEGLVLAGIDHGPRSADLRLADAASPDAAHTRLAGGPLTRPVAQQLERLLVGLDALVESEVGGLPVWVVHGAASRDLADAQVEAAAGIPAQVVVPRLCVDGNPPYMIGVLAAPGGEARIDAALAALRLSLPEGATPCPDEVIAPVRAAVEGGEAAPPVTQPDAPALAEAPLPEGWERLTRFGLSFAAPAGMEVRREQTERDGMEIWLQRRDAAGEIANEISIRVFSPAALAGMPLQDPSDPGFAGMLTTFAEMPVMATDERLELDGTTMHLFRGEAELELEDGMQPLRILYLIPEAPAANGLSAWFALHSAGQSPEAAEAFEQAFMASLSGAPEAPEEAPAAPVAEAPATQPPAVMQPEIPMPPPPAAAREPATATPSLAMGEAQAWEQALAQGTPEAMLAYLARYPRGLHSGEARNWLHARDIYAPDERRPVPAAVPPMPEPQPLTDEQAWQIARADGRVQGLWTYLKAFTQGLYAERARVMLATMLPPAPMPMPGRPEPRPLK